MIKQICLQNVIRNPQMKLLCVVSYIATMEDIHANIENGRRTSS